DLFQRLTANEIVVELDESAVADFVGRDIVVFDAVRGEAAADGAGRLVAVSAEPFAERLHFRIGVDSRKRGGDPAGLERVGGVSTRANGHDAELFTGVEHGAAYFYG